MKEKNITIKVNGMTQKQWGILLLELNLMKKAWKPFKVDMNISAPGLKKAIEWGTKPYADYNKEKNGNKKVWQILQK
jgi:hypothetical protein